MLSAQIGAVHSEAEGYLFRFCDFPLQLFRQLLKHELIRAVTQIAQDLVRHRAVQKDGVPVALIHVKAGDDVRILRPEQLRQHRLALERQQLPAVVALVLQPRPAGRGKQLSAHLIAPPAPFGLVVLHRARLCEQVFDQPVVSVHLHSSRLPLQRASMPW